MTTEWKTYEEAAAYILNQCASEFGLSKVEGKQSVPGLRSQTDYEIDAKGVREGKEGFVIIECRRYTTSKQNQDKLSSLAYKIIDAGAHGGIIVSPLGLQKGAQKIAQAENILSVQLNPDSTPHEFAMRFLNKIFVEIQESVSLHAEFYAEVIRICSICGQRFPVRENEQICATCKEADEK
jgi:hypothetical protein